jgi:hypothetical protein
MLGHMVGARVFVIGVFALLVVACDQGRTDGVLVKPDDARAALRRSWKTVGTTRCPGQPPHETTLVVGLAQLPRGGCTKGGLIAFAEDGHEFARHDDPMCPGDRWTIQDPGSVSPRGSAD